MNNYSRINNITGWLVFLFAAIVYLMTIEPTVSYWDCGEFIAAAYKLQVGHPPGAPLFLMIGRIFSLFAFGDTYEVAKMVNMMSGLCSAFTILFLFWTITAFGKKIAQRTGGLTTANSIAIFGSGIVGACAYTFTDSFWFSAVEGEVYAMSSLFTAVVFWAMLKWESVADEKHAERWIILIAYLMGLSIGVHLLNLLTIPALAFIYYFKKHELSRKGLIITSLIGIGVLVFVQYGIIPGVVSIASKFELLFVNSFGLPFNSGLIVYALLIAGLIIYGLYYTYRNRLPIWNNVILCITFILIGYSSFAMVVIRSAADPPMDENDPSNVFALLSYLNREQYGDRPLFYGQYYNSPLKIDYDKREYVYKDDSPVYYQGEKNGKDQYLIADERENSIPVYDPEFCTVFPRMYSSQSHHIRAYKNWGKVEGKKIRTPKRPDTDVVVMPTFFENLRFFFRYQLGHMYFRYFMWNFSGRQNNIQGHGGIVEGNFMTGIKFIDEAMLGSQENLPYFQASNKARNGYYLLPLILGIIGMLFQFKRDYKDGIVVSLLFFFTGIAIVIYLNQYPYQPRERDYAYAASFYAYAIWIGLAVYAIYDFLAQKVNGTAAASVSTLVCFLAAPLLLGAENWDDHDRSGRTTARDFAHNYLNSCGKNAILFTNGDNDTFPLWYAQEVEGFRTDVRVVNLSLLNTEWYIDQMVRKAYDSEALPISFTKDQYRQGTRDYIPYEDKGIKGYVEIDKLLNFIKSDSPKTKRSYGDKTVDIIPTKKIRIPVDSAAVVDNGYVPAKNAHMIENAMEWEIDKRYILKNDLMVLDILANNNWERPVYFAVTVGSDNYLGLDDFFQIEGMTYRIVPIKTQNPDGSTGRVETDVMYDNMMNKYRWGGMKDPDIYHDTETIRLTTGLRINGARLAEALVEENKLDSAVAVLDKLVEEMPHETIPYNFLMLPVAENYFRAKAPEKGKEVLQVLVDNAYHDLKYYLSLDRQFLQMTGNEIDEATSILQRSLSIAMTYQQKEIADDIEEKYNEIEGLMEEIGAF